MRVEVASELTNDPVKQKQRYDRKRKLPNSYKEGDQVVVALQVGGDGTSRKIRPKYDDLFQVIKCLPNDRYTVKEDKGLRISSRKKYDNGIAIDRKKPWVPPGGLSGSSKSSSDDN